MHGKLADSDHEIQDFLGCRCLRRIARKSLWGGILVSNDLLTKPLDRISGGRVSGEQQT
jgi:hypothetical protein